MGKNYFICNGVDSRDLDIHISELPPIKTPAQRVNKIIIPGRSGTLTELEGECIYDSYYRPFEIVTLNENKLNDIKNLLQGRCQIIFSNELEFVYDCSFYEEVEFIRTFKGWRRATLNPEFQPFKGKAMSPITEYIFDGQGSETPNIIVDTDVPCPFVAEFNIPDGMNGWFVFNEVKVLSSYTDPKFKSYKITFDNFLGTIYNDKNENILPYCEIYINDGTVRVADFPFLLKKGKNNIFSVWKSELKLTYQGRFL